MVTFVSPLMGNGTKLERPEDILYLGNKILQNNPVLFDLLGNFKVHLEEQSRYGTKVRTAFINVITNDIYISPSFLMGDGRATVQFGVFVIVHEMYHSLLHHFHRGLEKYDADKFAIPELANVAQDFALNLLVNDLDPNQFKVDEAWGGCFDEKYRGMTWERIYDSLLVVIEKEAQNPTCPKCGGGKQQPEGKDGDKHDDNVEDNQDCQGGHNHGQDHKHSNKGKPCNCSKRGMTMYTFDNHEGAEEDAEKARKEGEGEEESREALAATLEKHRGTETGQLLLRDLTLREAVVDWKRYIKQQMDLITRGDQGYGSYNKRNHGRSYVMPSTEEKPSKIDLYCAIDISGSISNDDAAAFLTELHSLCSKFASIKLTIWQFDMELHDILVIKDVSQIKSYEFKHGGGTALEPSMDKCRQDSPKLLLVMTDGYVEEDWGGRPPKTRVVALIKNGANQADAPHWVTAIHYDKLV